MLMPALGFITGCLFFAVIGFASFGLRRRRPTLKGLVTFVVGAMVTSAGVAFLYRVAVADSEGQLHSGGFAAVSLLVKPPPA
jgi:hypothetical protein